MTLKTIGLALLVSAFAAGSSFAAMQPIPNPPEKAAKHHGKKHHKAAPKAEAKADAKTDAAPAKDAKAAPAKK